MGDEPDRLTTGSRLLLGEIGRQRRALRRLLSWTGCEALPALLSGQLIGRAIDRGFLAGEPLVGLGHLAAFGAVHMVAALAVYRSYPAAGVIVEALRDMLVHRVVDTTLRRAASGADAPDQSVVARLVQQVETVRDVTGGLLLTLRRVTVTVIATVIGLVTLAPALFVLVLPPLVTAFAIFGGLMVLLARRQRDLILAEEHIAGEAGPVMTGLRDVIAFGAQRPMADRVDEAIDQHFLATRTLARANALRVIVVALGAHLPVILILAAGPSMVQGGLSVGDIAGAVTYLVLSLEPALRQLVHGIASSTLRLVITLRRLVETTTVPAAAPPCPQPSTRRGFLLELDRVTFAYGDGEPLVRELSLTVPEGDHIAIVGQSGIGKSTVANLIAGIERPTSGEIRIGGAPVHRLEPGRRHDSIVLIPQQAYVFAGTVADNLGYLRPELPQRDLDRAVELLGLVPLVSRLGGCRAEIRPAALSAGERQLIALARAYVSPAPVAVLDEATCQLDPRHEALAERAFADRPGTLIVIAHRISSALRARRILVVDGARAEIGVHSGHLATSPLYANLARNWAQPLADSPTTDQGIPQNGG